jgi:hypothetical protein
MNLKFMVAWENQYGSLCLYSMEEVLVILDDKYYIA